MKRYVLLWLLAVALIGPRAVLAQARVERLQAMDVDIWPDYDRPAVLVLLTGNLPPDVSLPAVVSVPIPAGAQLNAVARLDEQGGMYDDVEYEAGETQLTITTPERGFRVEYYAPYEENDGRRSYRFEWASDLSIEEFNAVVQEPAAAEGFALTPAAAEVTAGRGDGLDYHRLAAQALDPGQTLAIDISYTLPAATLTAPGASELPVPPDVEAVSVPSFASNWLIYVAGVAGLAVIGVVVWRLFMYRPARRPRKPQPRRTEPEDVAPPAAAYCHHCGEPLAAGDRFCRNCGTPVKGA